MGLDPRQWRWMRALGWSCRMWVSGDKRWPGAGTFARGVRGWCVRGWCACSSCQWPCWSKLRLGLDLQISWETFGKAHTVIHRAYPCMHHTEGKSRPKPSLLLWWGWILQPGNLHLQRLALLLSLVLHLCTSKPLSLGLVFTQPLCAD